MSESEIQNPTPGRPSSYDPKYCEMLIEHMEKGLSFEAFAGVVGTTKKTLYSWADKHEEFLNAKEIGTELSRIFWEKLGIDHIINRSDSEFQGGSSSRSLNASVWIFNMKNRFKWRDKQPDETDVVVNNITALPQSDLDARIAELVKKHG